MTKKHEKRPAPTVGEHVDSQFSDADIADISETDLRQRSEALNDAQEAWENLSFIATAKIPCHECGGRGVTAAGSFGDIECPNCHGKRVVEHPANDPLVPPPFAMLRAAITEYGDALADRLLPAGHRHKRGLALPAASTVPTIDAIGEILKDTMTRAKALKAAPGIVDEKLLGEARKKREGDDGGDFTDDDIDQQQEGNHDNDD